jgi:hypothetical protein
MVEMKKELITQLFYHYLPVWSFEIGT